VRRWHGDDVAGDAVCLGCIEATPPLCSGNPLRRFSALQFVD
jgi:hypothetical protein